MGAAQEGLGRALRLRPSGSGRTRFGHGRAPLLSGYPVFWHTVWSAREHDSEIDLGDVGCSIAALCVEVLVSDVVVVGVSLDGPPQFQTAMRGSVPSCFDVFRGVIVVSCEK